MTAKIILDDNSQIAFRMPPHVGRWIGYADIMSVSIPLDDIVAQLKLFKRDFLLTAIAGINFDLAKDAMQNPGYQSGFLRDALADNWPSAVPADRQHELLQSSIPYFLIHEGVTNLLFALSLIHCDENGLDEFTPETERRLSRIVLALNDHLSMHLNFLGKNENQEETILKSALANLIQVGALNINRDVHCA